MDRSNVMAGRDRGIQTKRRRVGIKGEARSAFGAGRTLRLAATGKVGHELPNQRHREVGPVSPGQAKS